MIGNRAQRLIAKTVITAAIVAAMVVVIIIFVRSGGNGTGAGAVTLRVNQSGSAGGAGRGGQSSAGEGGPPTPSGQQPTPSGQPGEEAGTGGGASGSGSPEGTGGNTSTPPSGATGTYTGPVVETLYGPVQVAVNEQSGRIADVKALQVPTSHPQSLYISERVTPLLREEVLQAQSARINIVSGATYTSDAYAESLQQTLSHIH